MFIETPTNKTEKRGWIEVITGSMFSGKTEELIRRLKRATIAMQKVEIFKPQIDVRYSEDEVISHDENAIRSTPVSTAGNILLLANDVDVVGGAANLVCGTIALAADRGEVAVEFVLDLLRDELLSLLRAEDQTNQDVRQ